jgi:hypothetical protein
VTSKSGLILAKISQAEDNKRPLPTTTADTASKRSEITSTDEPLKQRVKMLQDDCLIANSKEMLDQLKQATTDSELTQPIIEGEESKTDAEPVDEESQIIVEEGDEAELEKTVNVIAKDRSYMLSYMVAK